MEEFIDFAEEHIPMPMRRDLVAQGNLLFAWEMAARYLAADADSRADMLAFHESSGPEVIRQLKLRDADGTPTAADLGTDWECGKCSHVNSPYVGSCIKCRRMRGTK